MRKIFFSVLTALLLAVSICGCGGKPEDSAGKGTSESSLNASGDNELNQHIQSIHPEFVSLKENVHTKLLTSVKESDGLRIYEESVFNERGDLLLADYFKRVEAVDSDKADAKVREWKGTLGNSLEYISVEYVDGNVVVEYCSTNITALLNMGVLPKLEQEKQLKEKSGFQCRVD